MSKSILGEDDFSKSFSVLDVFFGKMSWNVEMKIRWKVEQVGVAASIYMRISQSCEKIVKSICQDYLGHLGPVLAKCCHSGTLL
jgi:hypothetical protein